MRIINPTHEKPAECYISDLLPGDAFERLGVHWLRTDKTEDSYIYCACLDNGRLEAVVSNVRVKPIFIRAVVE